MTKSAPGSQEKALTPSQRALDYVIKKLKDECDLQTVSIRSLANAISERRGKIEQREFSVDERNEHPTDEPETSWP